jgi:hypothetical protein
MSNQLYQWRIYRSRSNPAFIGSVQASDEDAALMIATMAFDIGPEDQDRLLALRQLELAHAETPVE